jgi:hypothetical protein
MNRREAVQSLTILTGGILSASAMGILLDSCHSNMKSGKGIQFTDDERDTVSGMADIIIPSTKIPGAVTAGVPAFVVMMMQQCYPVNDQDSFHKGLSAFDRICKQKYGNHFLKLSPREQIEAVKYLDNKVFGKNDSAGQSDESVSDFYRNLKGLTVLGYYSSKPGATEALRYLPVPGHYDGCIPYHKGDKEWAT